MDFSDLMKSVQSMAEQVRDSQTQMKGKIVTGDAGGGMVKAKMNGTGELVGLELDQEVIDPEDPELLADLILAAVNAAQKKVNEIRMEGLGKMTGGFDLSKLGIDPSQFV